jgi:hypothetical protein
LFFASSTPGDLTPVIGDLLSSFKGTRGGAFLCSVGVGGNRRVLLLVGAGVVLLDAGVCSKRMAALWMKNSTAMACCLILRMVASGVLTSASRGLHTHKFNIAKKAATFKFEECKTVFIF